MKTDRRGIIHIAGDRTPIGQRCIRCRTLLTKPGDTGWHPTVAVVNYGHGSWSVLRGEVNPGDQRPCQAKISR